MLYNVTAESFHCDNLTITETTPNIIDIGIQYFSTDIFHVWEHLHVFLHVTYPINGENHGDWEYVKEHCDRFKLCQRQNSRPIICVLIIRVFWSLDISSNPKCDPSNSFWRSSPSRAEYCVIRWVNEWQFGPSPSTSYNVCMSKVMHYVGLGVLVVA
jgi:hypothetical protein